MPHYQDSESATGDTATPSGQTRGLQRGEYSTPRSGVQPLERRIPIARQGTAFLVASAPAGVIALSFISQRTVTPTLIMTLAEARALGAALCDLADDLESDARAKDWSLRALGQIVAQADASAERYETKL